MHAVMYFASLPPEGIYDRRGDIICAIAQWSVMIQAVITTERQDRASENPDGTHRQCISVCPSDSWLSEENHMTHIRSDRKKELHAVFSYLFCCAGALCTILEFYFICISGIKNLNLNLN